MGFHEISGGGPIDGHACAAVDAGGVGIKKECRATGGNRGVFQGRGADERDAGGGEGDEVGGGFVAVELDGIDEAEIKKLAGLGGAGIDEDADAEDAAGEGFEESGVLWIEIALRSRPEIRAEGVDAEIGKFFGIGRAGDATDLERAGVGGEEVGGHGGSMGFVI